MRTLLAITAAGLGALAAHAAVLEITGSAEVHIRQFIHGEPADTADASDSFPTTDAELPIQVLARLVELDTDAPSAASMAAQFADPVQVFTPNPEEFALNMGLSSVSDSVSFTGEGIIREQRRVVFPPVEFGIGAETGDVLPFNGFFFVDGALAMVVREDARDLRDAFVRVELTIRKSGDSAAGGTVMNGSLELRGTADGDVQVLAGGDFPTANLVLTDLSLLAPDFDFVRVLIIPQLQIPYEYEAALGEEFTLEAELAVTGQNVPGDAGTLAVLGTPTDALAQVFAATQGDAASAKLMDSIRSEIRAPSGQPAFPATPSPVLGLCGLFGLESLAGLGLLGAWRRRRPIVARN